MPTWLYLVTALFDIPINYSGVSVFVLFLVIFFIFLKRFRHGLQPPCGANFSLSVLQ